MRIGCRRCIGACLYWARRFNGDHPVLPGVELTEPERQCIARFCQIGFMSPLEIRELPFDVTLSRFECDGLDKTALAAKLAAASFADLVAVVESLGF